MNAAVERRTHALPYGKTRRKTVGRGRLLRRVVLFQIKLMADGLRDVVMSPLSLIAGVLGFLFARNDPEAYFNRLMRFGRETDHWINLFDHRSFPIENGEGTDVSLDRIADRIEETVRRDYEAGGLSARAAEAMAEAVAHLRARARRN